jgi:hypothetical protein
MPAGPAGTSCDGRGVELGLDGDHTLISGRSRRDNGRFNSIRMKSATTRRLGRRACSAGSHQSPLDVGATVKARLPPLRIAWGKRADTIVNNGHTIQVNFAESSTRPQSLRGYRQRHVGAGKAEFGEPVIVDLRRTRMHDRPAHHAGQEKAIGSRHADIGMSCGYSNDLCHVSSQATPATASSARKLG